MLDEAGCEIRGAPGRFLQQAVDDNLLNFERDRGEKWFWGLLRPGTPRKKEKQGENQGKKTFRDYLPFCSIDASAAKRSG